MLFVDLTDQQRRFGEDARRWLTANVPPPMAPVGTSDGFREHLAFEKRLVAAGYAAIHWPTTYGGRGAGPVEQALFSDEYTRAGGPERVTVIGHNLFGPTLMRHGSEEQKQRWLPGILSADQIWSQGYSEPEAGSDLAGLRTRAVRDGDVYVVNGQKIWTSHGQYADWIFALVRTDPDADRHHGITMLAIDMASEGVLARPIRQLDGHTGFSEVFFEDVRVPTDQVIGRENQGWQVAMTALEFERDTPASSAAEYERALEELVAIARARGMDDDPVVRHMVAGLHVRVEGYRMHAQRTLALQVANRLSPEYASVSKLLWSELERDIMHLSRELLGETGEHLEELPGVDDPRDFRHRYWYARAAGIYAGTSEIQRNLISRQILGLPGAR